MLFSFILSDLKTCNIIFYKVLQEVLCRLPGKVDFYFQEIAAKTF